jgi:hypothetical protein
MIWGASIFQMKIICREGLGNLPKFTQLFSGQNVISPKENPKEMFITMVL